LTKEQKQSLLALGRQVMSRFELRRQLSERKRAEVAFRESAKSFEKAFHANPLAMSISRLEDGRFLDVNNSFLRFTGASRNEIIGKTSTHLGIWRTEEDRA